MARKTSANTAPASALQLASRAPSGSELDEDEVFLDDDDDDEFDGIQEDAQSQKAKKKKGNTLLIAGIAVLGIMALKGR